MTDFKIEYPPGATPLSPEARKGLIPDYIDNHGQLNQLEQGGIENALLWLEKRKKSVDVLDPGFIYELHRQMFKDVWRWAGKARNFDTSPGIDWHRIATELAQLLGDVKFWVEKKTYSPDEIAVRFHHRLVHIHIFPNGNGRHSRLMADLLLESQGLAPFTWGMGADRTSLRSDADRRKEYIAALKVADKQDYKDLMALSRAK